jgi:pyruvate,orthophosphate dikinase
MRIVRIGSETTDTPGADSIGAKAANLARMAAVGFPVPPAFVLPIELCAAIVDGHPGAMRSLDAGLAEGITFLEAATGKRLGDRRQPLLVSVRSGAARSMPGMLDTVLNVGCTSAAVHGLIRATGNPRFAWDCRRRFLDNYCSVVLGADPTPFARRLKALIAAEGVAGEHALDSEALERLAADYRQMSDDDENSAPEDAVEQLTAAAQAVYRSWNGPRACTYRQLEHLEHLRGTAVTVQAMVFGNRGRSSGAGVAFSRDPSTGSPDPIVDILFESQGEDVVSGRRTPDTEAAMIHSVPEAAAQLRETLIRLEREFADVQDIEFTIDEGKLWVLQTRSAKRTPRAALRFAIDLVAEGLIAPSEALCRLDGIDRQQLARQRLVDVGEPAGWGTGASSGVAVGRAAFESASADRLAQGGDPVILMRPDTSTADIAGFNISAGIVTAVGGRTAHAALVARQMGKPCVVGCARLSVDASHRHATLDAATIQEGDWISIDGGTGAIYRGRGKVVTERLDAELAVIERWQASASELGSPAKAEHSSLVPG